MTKNLDKDGLSSIVDNYQLFYIDLWGVVHNGVNLHKEAIKALKEISKRGKEYILKLFEKKFEKQKIFSCWTT